MTQLTDIENSEAVSTRPGVSRLRQTLADMIFIVSLAFGALPAAKFGTADGLLILIVVYYSSLIIIIGPREFTATLLGANVPFEEPPHWLTLAKSLLVVAFFLFLLLGAATAICLIAVSGGVRVALLIVIVASLWALMRCIRRRFLTQESAGRHRTDI